MQLSKYSFVLLVFILSASNNALSHPDESIEEITIIGRYTVLVDEARSASEGIIGQVILLKDPCKGQAIF